MVQGFVQIAIFCALIVAVVPLLGGHMARVFRGERTFIDPVAAPMERFTSEEDIRPAILRRVG
jgi:potassium-transporting ATPase potassium-binding subunit